jgi:hypothetical protein
MKSAHWLLTALFFVAIVAGCKDTPPEKPKENSKNADKAKAEDKYAENFAKLDPADRKIAEAQKYCAVENENRLGSMGTPYKLMVKDQPVFLCCKSCQKQALADPDKTLAKIEELKKKSVATP